MGRGTDRKSDYYTPWSPYLVADSANASAISQLALTRVTDVSIFLALPLTPHSDKSQKRKTSQPTKEGTNMDLINQKILIAFHALKMMLIVIIWSVVTVGEKCIIDFFRNIGAKFLFCYYKFVALYFNKNFYKW